MKRFALQIVRSPTLIPLVLLIIACIIGMAYAPQFFGLNYILDRSSDLMPIALLALAMTFIIIAGQIDLSVGSGAVLVMVVTALLYRDKGVPMGALILIAPLLGALLGLFNGVMVTALRVPPLVVTLGTLALYRGVAMVLMGEQSIGKFPAWFVGLNMREVAGVQCVPVLMFIGVAIIAAIVLQFSTFGRRVYSVGTNENASRYAGIRTDRVKLILFIWTAVSSSFVGIMSAVMYNQGNASQGQGYVFQTAIVAVIGGVLLQGGFGSVTGIVLGCIIYGIVSLGLFYTGWPTDWLQTFIGALLVLAVLTNNVIRNAALSRGRKRS